jgi:DNA-binding NarL/FixJ family response regulator
LPEDQITVLLADDHTMFREGLAGLLASYGACV